VLTQMNQQEWVREDFADEGHFSRAGGMKFAQVLAPLIRRLNESGKSDPD